MMESDADLLHFLIGEEFASTITVGGTDYLGVLDNGYMPTDGMEGTDPYVLMRDVDITNAGIVEGTALSINNGKTTASYTARTPEPDGQGLTRLRLFTA